MDHKNSLMKQMSSDRYLPTRKVEGYLPVEFAFLRTKSVGMSGFESWPRGVWNKVEP